MTVIARPAPPVPARRLRHRSEMPLLVAGIVLTVIVVHASLTVLAIGGSLRPWAAGVLVGLLSPVVALLVIRVSYWRTISNSVEVTPHQFPELFELYVEAGHRMGFGPGTDGLGSLPRLYVINGNGTLNAFASKCRVSRAYVVISSDLVDVAYERSDFAAVQFVLAHELGHVLCGHVSLWRQMVRPILAVLLLDKSLTRAQEYTADRVAARFAPEGARGLVVLFAGKNLAHRVDQEAYFTSVAAHGDPFWLRVVNFFSDHPVGFRRMQALSRLSTDGWDVHGRML